VTRSRSQITESQSAVSALERDGGRLTISSPTSLAASRTAQVIRIRGGWTCCRNRTDSNLRMWRNQNPTDSTCPPNARSENPSNFSLSPANSLAGVSERGSSCIGSGLICFDASAEFLKL
jgi:hypothetical protein